MNREQLPNFLIIGAARCGTTSLFSLLCQHPEVFGTTPKEPQFFAWHDFEDHRQWYEGLFAKAGGYKARGEASVCYTLRSLHPETAEQIHRYVPDVKLIYLVRHPVERLKSNWRLHYAEQDIPSGTDINAVLREPFFMDRLVHRSKYWYQIEAFRAYFPDEQIKVVFFEDYLSQRNQVLAELFQFLDVDPAFTPETGGEEQNAYRQRLLDNLAVRCLRKVPGFTALRDAVPKRYARAAERQLKRGQEIPSPVLNEENMAWLREELLPDTRAFCRFYGKTEDFWTF